MSRITRFALLVAVACIGSGCAARLIFVDRTDGTEYHGTTGGTAGSEGQLNAEIDGSSYTGTWIYSASGGGYSLGTGVATSGATTAMVTSSAIGVSASGNGMMHMKAASGSFIRCVFSFNEFTDSGIGECLRNDGRQYDVRIRR